MWPDLEQAFISMLSKFNSSEDHKGWQVAPPLKSYQDTLGYLVGGQPAVVDRQLGEGVYGSYTPIQPAFGIKADTIAINPDPRPNNIPRDFTLAHEMGHRLYYANEPLPSQVTPQGTPSPELQAIIQHMHDRAQYSNLNEGEGFAQAFAQGLQGVRGHPYTPPASTGPGNPDDVRRMQEWIHSKLAERNPGVMDWLRHISSSLMKDSYWNTGSAR